MVTAAAMAICRTASMPASAASLVGRSPSGTRTHQVRYWPSFGGYRLEAHHCGWAHCSRPVYRPKPAGLSAEHRYRTRRGAGRPTFAASATGMRSVVKIDVKNFGRTDVIRSAVRNAPVARTMTRIDPHWGRTIDPKRRGASLAVFMSTKGLTRPPTAPPPRTKAAARNPSSP